MDYTRIYAEKKTDIGSCLDLIHSGDVLSLAGDCNEPLELCAHLHELADRVDNVVCYKCRAGEEPFLTAPGMDGHINTRGFFYGPGWRKGHVLGNCTFIPCDLNDYAGFNVAHRPPTVFAAAVSPMDEEGNFCLGLCLMWETQMIRSCDRILLEVNPALPRVNGGLKISVKDVAALVEVDYPLLSIPDKAPTPEELRVAQNVRSLMRDGDCIQLGIGSLPNAIASACMDLKDLGLHTEMATSSMGEMIRRGVITGARKNLNPGEHIFTFACGDTALYKTIGETPACRIVPANYGVNPMVIMQNDNMVSVNTCIQVDLTGQICAETIGPKQYSGSGGSFDYAYGALHARGGRGIMAFTSTTPKGISKIKAFLDYGAAVTVPRAYADYIVTEYGVAALRGRTVKERVEQLIAVAHPDFREELRSEARKQFYI